jgi:hypothetical protein
VERSFADRSGDLVFPGTEAGTEIRVARMRVDPLLNRSFDIVAHVE